MNECVPCHKYEWVHASFVTRHVWLSDCVSSCHTYECVSVSLHCEWSCHIYKWGSTRECVPDTYRRHNEGAETRWPLRGIVSTRSVLHSVAVCCGVMRCVAVPDTYQRQNEGAELRHDDRHADLCRHAARSCPQKSPISLQKSHIFPHHSPVCLPKSPISLHKSPIPLQMTPVRRHTGSAIPVRIPPPALLQGGNV